MSRPGAVAGGVALDRFDEWDVWAYGVLRDVTHCHHQNVDHQGTSHRNAEKADGIPEVIPVVTDQLNFPFSSSKSHPEGK